MTIYTDDSATTDYAETLDFVEEPVVAYEEPTASCCCGSEVDYEPAPGFYGDVPEDDGSIWASTEAPLSDVIPAGQPGGPAAVPTIDGDLDWETQDAHQDLYPTVAPIGAPEVSQAHEPTNGFGQGFSALASTPSDSSFGSPSGFGTGFSALDTTSPSALATTFTINPTVDPLGQLYAKAADQGDIMTQIMLAGVQRSQSSIGSSWL